MSTTRTTATSLATWIRQAKAEPTFAAQTICSIVGCTSIPFVEVRARGERAHVCLHHYQEARAIAAGVEGFAINVA